MSEHRSICLNKANSLVITLFRFGRGVLRGNLSDFGRTFAIMAKVGHEIVAYALPIVIIEIIWKYFYGLLVTFYLTTSYGVLQDVLLEVIFLLGLHLLYLHCWLWVRALLALMKVILLHLPRKLRLFDSFVSGSGSLLRLSLLVSSATGIQQLTDTLLAYLNHLLLMLRL